jgi:uncharacterized YccA/Bax inhibitor family protein
VLEVRPLQSSNPAFSETFVENFAYANSQSRTMTVEGTAIKAVLLLAIMSTTFCVAWTMTETGKMSYAVIGVSSLLSFVVAMITCFKPLSAPWTSPIYAALQGIALGGISRAVEATTYPGIALQAVVLSGGVTFLMLFIYATRLIKVTGQLASAVIAATGGICLLYLGMWIYSMFGGDTTLITGSGPFSIGFSVFVVGLAAFNLLLDFDFIEKGSEQHLSKAMEWYGAFALMITLVWMYRQILDLLRKLNSRD